MRTHVNSSTPYLVLAATRLRLFYVSFGCKIHSMLRVASLPSPPPPATATSTKMMSSRSRRVARSRLPDVHARATRDIVERAGERSHDGVRVDAGCPVGSHDGACDALGEAGGARVIVVWAARLKAGRTGGADDSEKAVCDA